MNIMNINDINTPFLGAIFSVLILFPKAIEILTIKNKKSLKMANSKFEGLKIISVISFVITIVLMCIKREYADIKNVNLLFGITCFFYIMYIELLFKYIFNGRKIEDIFKPFMYVKIPMHISFAGTMLFVNIWSGNIITIITSLIFAITSLVCAYNVYTSNICEYRDLYDENRKPLGKKVLKGAKVPKGQNYVTVVVFMYNPKNNKWLMQKRTKDKGGKWATTSGHPVSGQTSIEGMVTEIKEELGLSVKESELKLITTVKRKDKFADIYYMEKDVNLDEIVMQKEEVDDVCYMTTKEVDEFYKASKYKKTHYMYFHEMLAKKK